MNQKLVGMILRNWLSLSRLRELRLRPERKQPYRRRGQRPRPPWEKYTLRLERLEDRGPEHHHPEPVVRALKSAHPRVPG